MQHCVHSSHLCLQSVPTHCLSCLSVCCELSSSLVVSLGAGIKAKDANRCLKEQHRKHSYLVPSDLTTLTQKHTNHFFCFKLLSLQKKNLYLILLHLMLHLLLLHNTSAFYVIYLNILLYFLTNLTFYCIQYLIVFCILFTI